MTHVELGLVLAPHAEPSRVLLSHGETFVVRVLDQEPRVEEVTVDVEEVAGSGVGVQVVDFNSLT